jgi:signal transduction histidine kinase
VTADRSIELPLWRGVAVFRTLTLVYAVVLYAGRSDEYARPALGWVTLALMAAWTAWWWLRGRPPSSALVVADLVVACAAAGMTVAVDTPERIAAGAQTLPVIWPAAAVLSWAVWRGWRGGLVTALALAAVNALVAGRLSGNTLHNNVLMLLLGTIIGYSADLVRSSHHALRQALAVEAATAERERLARDIHDSVLQVLAFVQRRGREIGGESADLGRLAGEQEQRLRRLVAAAPARADGASPGGARALDGPADVRTLLSHFENSAVTVVVPATPVPLPLEQADELAAAVGAALDNVERHAGAAARAWVLVEDEDHAVTVTVRDDGLGMPDGRLAEAERAGRLGVSQSIRGRLAGIGGQLRIISAPGEGVELVLTVPRRVDV